jgi:xylulokinase
VRAVAPSLLGVPVVVPEPGEYVARGAARQAAWALAGGEPPDWALPATSPASGDLAAGQRVRAAYAVVRDEALEGVR